MFDRNSNKRKIFSPFVIAAGFVFGCLLLIFSFIAFSLIRPSTQKPSSGTALIQIIEVPTKTPIIASPVPTETSAPQPGTPLPPPAGVIKIGTIVEIKGTGTDGLRIRDQSGLQGKILFVAIESEVFRVTDGPKESDGYTWWKIVSPFDETIQGWAVSNYLGIGPNQ